jgi:hypothetical protein
MNKGRKTKWADNNNNEYGPNIQQKMSTDQKYDGEERGSRYMK